MITKKQFCEAILREKCNPAHEIMDSSVYTSDSIAVCMEYLELIKSEEAKVYALKCNGVFMMARDNFLTTREMISMLPE